MNMNVSLVLGVSQCVIILTENKEFPEKTDIFHLKQTQQQKQLRNGIFAMKVNSLLNQKNKAEGAKPLAILDFVQVSS